MKTIWLSVHELQEKLTKCRSFSQLAQASINNQNLKRKENENNMKNSQQLTRKH